MSASAEIKRDFSEGRDPAVLRTLIRDFRDAQKSAKSAQGAARNAKKRMKDGGVDLAAFDLANSLNALDPADAINLLNKTIFLLQTMHSALGMQLNFFDVVDANMPVSDEERAIRWKADGAAAFLSGQREVDCPHSAELPAGQCWLQGFRDAEWEAAQAKTKIELAEANKVDEIPPQNKKRGRPPKNGAPTLVVDNDAPITNDPNEDEIPFVEPAAMTASGDLPPEPPLDDLLPA